MLGGGGGRGGWKEEGRNEGWEEGECKDQKQSWKLLHMSVAMAVTRHYSIGAMLPDITDNGCTWSTAAPLCLTCGQRVSTMARIVSICSFCFRTWWEGEEVGRGEEGEGEVTTCQVSRIATNLTCKS